jgi:hypothetical protein
MAEPSTTEVAMPENNTTASAFEFTVDLRRPGFVAGEQAVIEALIRLHGPAKPARSRASRSPWPS